MPQATSATSSGPSSSTPVEGSSYVGIDTLQEQTRLRALGRGYTFNLLVVGRSGLGKSTLVNSLFKTTVSRRKAGEIEPLPKTTQVRHISSSLAEGGVRLSLTVTDTPGFGDHINNENCWEPIVSYIEEQYETYLKEEQKVVRLLKIPDTRVHCCIYFIPPTGHSLSSLDVEVLKRLDKVTNVVPVIAKADTLTLEERSSFKERIRADLSYHGISVYPPPPLQPTPTLDSQDPLTLMPTNTDYTHIDTNNKIRERLPFAVVGSGNWHELHGRTVLGRRCSWGLVEVENKNHNDFAHLRDMLIRTHMQDLIDSTSERHYENYRRLVLSGQGSVTNGQQQNSDEGEETSHSKM